MPLAFSPLFLKASSTEPFSDYRLFVRLFCSTSEQSAGEKEAVTIRRTVILLVSDILASYRQKHFSMLNQYQSVKLFVILITVKAKKGNEGTARQEILLRQTNKAFYFGKTANAQREWKLREIHLLPHCAEPGNLDFLVSTKRLTSENFYERNPTSCQAIGTIILPQSTTTRSGFLSHLP